jgi:putative flippase GtrA
MISMSSMVQDPDLVRRRFARFSMASALGIVVQLGVLWVLMRGLQVHYLVATPLAVLAAVLHNFVWHWRWTWADRGIPIAGAPAALARFVAANGAVSIVGNIVVMAVLVRGAGLAAVPANVLAIALCGLVNYWLGDAIVFTARRV